MPKKTRRQLPPGVRKLKGRPRERKGEGNNNHAILTMRDLEAFPFRCVNCLIAFEDVKLYCSELCEQEAAYVRYARRCRLSERYQGPDVKEAIIIRLALILGGGYDKRARQLPDSLRRSVIQRDEGKCQACGQPGEEIDHISGNSSDPANLQLLCNSCHNKKTVSSFRRITEASHPEEWARWQWLRFRVEAKDPVLICDSDKWNGIQKELMRKRQDVLTGQGGLFE